MIYSVICAGGTGTRMGGDVPKQFLELDGEPIIIKTVRKFAENTGFVFVGMNPEWVEYTLKLFKQYNISEKVKVVAGGTDRMATILNVIYEMEKTFTVSDDDVIVTHDAVRPFVTEKIIKENIEMCKKYDCAATFVNAVDTIAVSLNGKTLSEVPKRENMYNVQTPQTVKFGILKESILKHKENFGAFTDLCGMLLSYGKEVYMVPGDYSNIKITVPADISK
jgi:2-C-methyl-D-erythritol 4-phosphate cytidylyltransferase